MTRSSQLSNKFRALLNEAGVQFQKPSQWRDNKKKTQTRGKKYRWRGKMLTVRQLIEVSGCGLSMATLNFRLSKGWAVNEAVTKPLICNRESGRMGAEVTNGRRVS